MAELLKGLARSNRMPVAIDIFTAQYQAAATAYGWDGARPAMSDDFAKTFATFWIAMAEGDPLRLRLGGGAPALGMSGETYSAYVALKSADSTWYGMSGQASSSDASELWQAAGAIAGTIGNYQLPNLLDYDGIGDLQDAAKNGADYLEAKMSSLVSAVGWSLGGGVLLLLLVGGAYLYLYGKATS